MISNRFIFTCHDDLKIRVICNKKIFRQTIKGKEILKLSPNCSLSNSNIQIDIKSIMNPSEIIVTNFKFKNISIWENKSITDTSFNFKFHNLTEIEQMIKDTKENSYLHSIDRDDFHHYIVIYVVVISIILLTIL